jgi:DNA helicase-2/ATP-dependent DNA helicase PcrA
MIDIQLIKNESVSDLHGVFIIPVYMSKGLEFDVVLICDTDITNYNNEDDKKLLYIASTRALHRLNLFCKGEVSPLL